MIMNKTLSSEEARALYFSRITGDNLKFLDKFKINSVQLEYLKLLYLENFKWYYCFLGLQDSLTQFTISKETVNDLYNKGLVTQRWTSDKLPNDHDQLTDLCRNAIEEIFKLTSSAVREMRENQRIHEATMLKCAKEFFDTYPDFVVTGNGRITLKACNEFTFNNRIYEGKNSLMEIYLLQINNDLTTHKKVISLLRKFPEHPLSRIKITTFVVDKRWEDMQEETTQQFF